MGVEQGSRNPEPSTAAVGVTKVAGSARARELARLAAQVKATGCRILGLNKGPLFMSEDFNDELPDDFWFGEE